jgi:inosose dehydratase
MTDAEWPVFLANLARPQKIASDLGLTCTLHPQCRDGDRRTGTRYCGWWTPATSCCAWIPGISSSAACNRPELLERAAERVAHVHLKDVRLPVAEVVAAGGRSYIEAVRAGLYAPLGQGDLDIARIVAALERCGYQGWYVLEQDEALFGEPANGSGPVEAVRASIDFISAAVA